MLRSLDEVELIGGALDHPEGLAFYGHNLYAGGEAGQIYEIAWPSYDIRTIADTEGFILGVTLDGRGRIYACDIKHHVVWRIEGQKRDVYTTGTADRPLVTPNWSVFDPVGNLFVSDSGTWRANDGGIFLVDPRGRTQLWTGLARCFPNGITLAPDYSALYVAESTLPGISRIEIRADGSPGAYDVVARTDGEVPDGIAFDQAGNLYIGCYRPDRITVLSPTGTFAIFLEDPEGTVISAPTNVAFGGPDGTDLVWASLGRWSLGHVKVETPGHPLNYPKF